MNYGRSYIFALLFSKVYKLYDERNVCSLTGADPKVGHRG